ncbi:hypothetical protein Nepgr_031803 [Nepenthes gracilis]|uniref:Uncharacterized protein n=1 Tax=Nepenthes gracilis TaxID=150966 RepID=A0AAD3THE9_NEPGR|nr:hypothetical protein Nepgr_031803 [Nepenthes gracilis]
MIIMAVTGMDLTQIGGALCDGGGSTVALCKYMVGLVCHNQAMVIVDDGAVNGSATLIIRNHDGDDSLDITIPLLISMSNVGHHNHPMNDCFDCINELKMFHM